MRHSRRTNEVKASDAYDAKGYMPNQSSASRGRKGAAPDWAAVAFVTFVGLRSAWFGLLRFWF